MFEVCNQGSMSTIQDFSKGLSIGLTENKWLQVCVGKDKTFVGLSYIGINETDIERATEPKVLYRQILVVKDT